MTSTIIKKTLNKKKIKKKSSGPDKILSNLLKSTMPVIMNPICHLFNLLFKSGCIPTILKTAKIAPIFKTGETDKLTNYRPVVIRNSL